MRISDWSSDGCSSDLFVHMLDVAARTKGFALAGQHDGADAGIAGDARAQFGDFLAVPRLGYRVALVGAVEGRDQNRDRQSVVEGKSVSVRVDLGGRRFITTKKHKHTAAQPQQN